MRKTPKIGIITQARTGSTRLPGKILLPVNGKSLLRLHLERLQGTGLQTILATSTNPLDFVLTQFAMDSGIPFIQGSETDVFSRYLSVWESFQFDVMIRVTSDCPLLSPGLIKEGLAEYLSLSKNPGESMIYYSNTLDRTFARGFDFEIFSSAMLLKASRHALNSFEREHVTPFFYKNSSAGTTVVQKKQDRNNSSLRVTLDEMPDYLLIRKLIMQHQADRLDFEDIENLFSDHPDLIKINAQVYQKSR